MLRLMCHEERIDNAMPIDITLNIIINMRIDNAMPIDITLNIIINMRIDNAMPKHLESKLELHQGYVYYYV